MWSRFPWASFTTFRVVGYQVFTKPYSSKLAFVSYQQKSAYILRLPLPQNQLLDVMSQEYRHHSNKKPVSIQRPLLEGFTRSDGLVLDPFVGSGSTCVAADQCGRRWIDIELLASLWTTPQVVSVSADLLVRVRHWAERCLRKEDDAAWNAGKATPVTVTNGFSDRQRRNNCLLPETLSNSAGVIYNHSCFFAPIAAVCGERYPLAPQGNLTIFDK